MQELMAQQGLGEEEGEGEEEGGEAGGEVDLLYCSASSCHVISGLSFMTGNSYT